MSDLLAPQRQPGDTTAPQQPSTAVSATPRTLWRAARAPLAVALLLVVVAAATVLLGGQGRPGRYLDPDDGSLAGGRALAALLRAHGVTVDRVDSADRAAALASGDRLLLVTDAFPLTPSEVGRLADLPGDLLIVGDTGYLHVLAPEVRANRERVRERSREPRCDLPGAQAAGSAHIGGLTFSGPRGAVGCYPADDKPTLLRYASGGRTVTVVGSSGFMTNQRLDEDGNAALALNLLRGKQAVTWLVRPAPEEGESQDDETLAGPEGKSFHELMPDNVGWGVWMALIALLLTILWRGRRLGPVVAERLPVVVRAAETVEGRGRLYRARRARGTAAEALRAGALDRIVPRLGLTADAGPDAVVSAIAVRTGQDPRQIGAALYGPPPADDAGLVGLAGYLDFLEKGIQ
ncbi:DUF4350 domain-containing protein [Thermoactinospora rubra]|uniref:DUF4350 domain-containing protein n=1 Tax=Thermoactinospora rubra TaxID=1088767 RepID=UPI000A102330|nr:DUF4350 domain-containing protein [Thermoactinospora rubra]